MTRHQRSSKPPESHLVQFETPTRPSPSATSKAPKSNASKRAISPDLKRSTKNRRRPSPLSSHAQSTLTQIDFVTQTTQPENAKLEYLESPEPGDDAQNAPAPVDGESDNDDAEYKPSSRTRRAHSTFETNDDHPKRRRKSGLNTKTMDRGQSIRKSQTPRASVGPKGKRKAADKSTEKRNKTLTQMDFVRRYIPIDDDDENDVNMGYIETTPKNVQNKQNAQKPTWESLTASNRRTPASAKQARRMEADLDLSTGEPLSDPRAGHMGENDSGLRRDSLPEGPITPHKRKLEIPSSQSPESPGLAIITSSQFRSATRSPLKRKSPDSARFSANRVKEETVEPQHLAPNLQDEDFISPERTPTARLSQVLIASSQRPTTFSERLASCDNPNKPMSQRPVSSNHEPVRTQGDRTVIYETDAETSSSDCEHDEQDEPPTPSRVQDSQIVDTHLQRHDSDAITGDDSHELPLPNVQAASTPDDEPNSEIPMSDASMYYQRLQPATQFPHEPIPALNTQKLSELFPSEGPTQYARPGPAPRRVPSPPQFPGPFLQTQTQSQDMEEPEMVPESSPARGHDDTTEGSALPQRSMAPESVQVESSQPVERANMGGGNMLSRSQLLTSSVMESVPLPNFWIGSQDSVGEPYSL